MIAEILIWFIVAMLGFNLLWIVIMIILERKNGMISVKDFNRIIDDSISGLSNEEAITKLEKNIFYREMKDFLSTDDEHYIMAAEHKIRELKKNDKE